MKKRYTVLLAEDDKVQTAMLSQLLRQRGYSVATAYDATYTFMVAMKSPPDVVVLDIMMPGGTGKAVLTRLKGSSKTAQIPVIVLSGLADRRVIEEVRALGACDYLVKPADINTLDAAIHKALGIPAEVPSAAPAPAASATPDTASPPSGAAPAPSDAPPDGSSPPITG
jgi:DNA-binding response OmpR family regulator